MSASERWATPERPVPSPARPRRRVLRRVVATVLAVVIAAAAWFAWRVWDGFFVRPSEARDALAALPYDIRYRRLARPDGVNTAIAGRARDRRGNVVDFGVLLGGHPRTPVVPGAGQEEAISDGNATVITNTPGAFGPDEPDAVVDMRLAIEDAIFAREPLRPDEG